ncbi:MAG: Rid family detoxifying hydrolase [Desulfobacterales bacterium]|nr:Rid family detoxifying hydrolase [Desulfobacterales bacterium]
MKPNVIQTNKAPSAIGPYSQAISSGPFIFVSGQLGLDPKTGEMISEELPDQAKQSLENMLNIVNAGKGDISHIVSVDVFLTDMNNFSVFNEIYQAYFKDHKPARAVVGVNQLPKGALIEIKCLAITGT